MIKNMPNAIIDIPLRMEFKDQHPVYEVMIKMDDKVIYHNKTYAVVMNMVQSVTKLDIKTMELEGDSQIVGAGHPIIQWFALDQLRKKLTEVTSAATDMLVEFAKKGGDKEELTKVLEQHFAFIAVNL